MDLSSKQTAQEGVEKFDIKLKTKPKDGVILQLHHTIRSANGETRRIRFVAAAFNDANDRLACADNSGNLFILDFSELKFWKLTQAGPCSAMHFMPEALDTLVVSTMKKTYDVCFLDVESGAISVTLSGHSAPVKHMSFSSSKSGNLLTASPSEAIIWELRNYTKFFTLNTYKGAQIQQIMFTPACDNLVACFQNDTVQIWKHETMKSVKQIIPSELKHMKSIAFTLNGRAMVMAGLTPTLILFSLDTWRAIKSIDLSKYNVTGVKQVSFIPQVFDGGSNKILAILTSDCILHIFDLETAGILYTVSPESSVIRKLIVSPTGKYFVCILQLGEVNIYNSGQVMDLALHDKGGRPCPEGAGEGPAPPEHLPAVPPSPPPHRHEVESRMRVCMDSARLRRILMQYGEYPDKFRSIIWRALLITPRNKNAYISLVNKNVHPSYKDIEKRFTIHSSVTLKNLKRLLSCLAHWCPLFGVLKFLPGFVFPFVKVLQKDPLLLFECVTSIIINYCQLWFEYSPFPPINVLAIIENILAEHDQTLLDHFCKVGVTSQTYALNILETAFSEVLSGSEWLILWDHILSNEPSFILMAVVSYNMVHRNTLKKLTTHEQFEAFFHMQNSLDKKYFLKKTYHLLNETSEEFHPRKYLNSYTPMERGSCYPQFTSYPTATVCMKLAERDRKKTSNTQAGVSLRELTTKSQEKEIAARLAKDQSSGEDGCLDTDDDTSSLDGHRLQESSPKEQSKKFNSKFEVPKAQVENENSKTSSMKNATGDRSKSVEGRKTAKSNTQQAATSKASSNEMEDDFSMLSSGSKCRKHRQEKNAESLEKEVEKLMNQYLNSEHDLS